ncbi:hypothetical protein DFQ30_004181 [Apophysomyces sp. BC1015]|nr:hypothetical protein DFQ30_004181 [Apophysomyces sp. BC1015]KAG0163752.1 hypothetical protein DFQ29_002797 [Apophysomyces sp. BC1021]
MDSFTVCCDKPFMRQSSSNFWAQHCFLLSKSTIEHFANADGNLDPLVALSMFLTYKQRCIMTLDRWDDPTIVALYSIAKAIFEHIRQGEDEKLEALQTVCQVTEAQFQKIYDRLKAEIPQSSKTLRYVEDGLKYTGHLKRTYQEAMLNNVEENAESVTPMEQPPPIASSSKKNIGETPANPVVRQ